MNYRGCKRIEAKRLKDRMEETKMFSSVRISRKRNSFWVMFNIHKNNYAFPITVEHLRKNIGQRTEAFDGFVAQCIMHASQMRAIEITLEKNTKEL